MPQTDVGAPTGSAHTRTVNTVTSSPKASLAPAADTLERPARLSDVLVELEALAATCDKCLTFDLDEREQLQHCWESERCPLASKLIGGRHGR